MHLSLAKLMVQPKFFSPQGHQRAWYIHLEEVRGENMALGLTKVQGSLGLGGLQYILGFLESRYVTLVAGLMYNTCHFAYGKKKGTHFFILFYFFFFYGATRQTKSFSSILIFLFTFFSTTYLHMSSSSRESFASTKLLLASFSSIPVPNN